MFAICSNADGLKQQLHWLPLSAHLLCRFQFGLFVCLFVSLNISHFPKGDFAGFVPTQNKLDWRLHSSSIHLKVIFLLDTARMAGDGENSSSKA